MKKIESAASILPINDTITLKQLMCISDFARSYSGSIKIVRGRQEINMTNIPALTAFFLTLRKGSKISIHVNGPDVQSAINRIEDVCISGKTDYEFSNASLI
jgi:phosphotransferase system HPr-like phosphotransfer protein